MSVSNDDTRKACNIQSIATIRVRSFSVRNTYVTDITEVLKRSTRGPREVAALNTLDETISLLGYYTLCGGQETTLQTAWY